MHKLLPGLAAGALSLALAPSALAFNASGFANGTFTITGEQAGQSYTVALVNNDVVVSGPVFQNDPDNNVNDANCAIAGDSMSVRCKNSVVTKLVINAGDGVDTLIDTRDPSGDTDELNGEGGNDILRYEQAGTGSWYSGSVKLSGGAGDDELTTNGNTSAVVLHGEADNDTFRAIGNAQLNNPEGGPGNDVFYGSDENSDYFNLEPGADTYYGGTRTPKPTELVTDPAQYQQNEASDSFSADGDDAVSITLNGVADDGRPLEGDNIADDFEYLSGSRGDDVMTAGVHSVDLYGGRGNDQLTGSPEGEQLGGDEGNDVLRALGGDDRLGDGDSTVAFIEHRGPNSTPVPVPGNDVLDGGAGNDRFDADAGADDIIGGPGEDRASFDVRPVVTEVPPGTPSGPYVAVPANGFDISLDDVANDGARGTNEGDNVHSDIERIDTTGSDSSQSEIYDPNTMTSKYYYAEWVSGDDVITGTDGAQTLNTGDGNDTITPGGGPDTVASGAGADIINAVDATTDRIDCGAGPDAVSADLAGEQAPRADLLIDCETVSGTPFPKVFSAGPVDVSKVRTTLSAKTVKSASFLKSGLISLTLTCDKTCSAEGEALVTGARLRTVGQLSIGSGKLAAGTGKRTLKVKVAKSYLKSYKKKLRTKKQRKKGISVTVRVTVTSATGVVSTLSKKVSVKG